MSGARSGEFDERLLERLVCPVTRTALRYDAAAQELIAEATGEQPPQQEQLRRDSSVSHLQCRQPRQWASS